jgi:hypothetical protein
LTMSGRLPDKRDAARRRRRGSLPLSEIVNLKAARRKQERDSRRKTPRPAKRLPTWAYFAALVLLAAVVTALRSL